MANFDIDSVEPLDYDFRGFQKNDAPRGEMCSGFGEIPEPTQKILTAYAKGTQELFQVETQDEVEKALDAEAKLKQDAAEAKQRKARLHGLTAALCQNSPTARELGELPPRIANAFMKWVYKELSDPEVLSAGTPD